VTFRAIVGAFCSRVSELGTERLHSVADLAALVRRLRAGALLFSTHPLLHGPSANGQAHRAPHCSAAASRDRELEEDWSAVRRALEWHRTPAHKQHLGCDATDATAAVTTMKETPAALASASRRLEELHGALFVGAVSHDIRPRGRLSHGVGCSGGGSGGGSGGSGGNMSLISDGELSAADPAEIERWVADAGTAAAPGAGSSALQLQAFLDGVCGGWSNSFG
jgi:hypothetical protein